MHEEVVDLVDVVRLLDEHDIFFTSLRLDNFIQFLDISSVIIGLELVFFESLFDNKRDFALFVVPEEILIFSLSESRRGFSLTFEISDPNSSETGLPVLT